MRYQEARKWFRDGDIVFFSGGNKNLIRRVITWFSGGPYYHVGIAFWASIGDERRLFIAEAQPGGYRVINLAYYEDRDMAVFPSPLPWAGLSKKVMSGLGKIQYGLLDLLVIGLHEKFRIPLLDRLDGPGDVCSVVIAKLLKEGGVCLDTMVSPQRLFTQISRMVPRRLAVTAA